MGPLAGKKSPLTHWSSLPQVTGVAEAPCPKFDVVLRSRQGRFARQEHSGIPSPNDWDKGMFPRPYLFPIHRDVSGGFDRKSYAAAGERRDGNANALANYNRLTETTRKNEH
jgi:hypothetical protein